MIAGRVEGPVRLLLMDWPSRESPCSGPQFRSDLPEKGLALTFGEDAGVAQLAEQLFCKQQVTGSIPVAGSSF
jgi:hypothetical protein